MAAFATAAFAISTARADEPKANVIIRLHPVGVAVPAPTAPAVPLPRATSTKELVADDKLFRSTEELAAFLRDAVGDGGSITAAASSGALVVTGPTDMTARVDRALASLGKLQAKRDRLIVVEEWLIEAPVGFGKAAKLDEGGALSPREVAMLKELVKVNPNASTVTHPRLTLADSQSGVVQVGQKVQVKTVGSATVMADVGTRQEVMARTSDDGRTITLQIRTRDSRVSTGGGVDEQTIQSSVLCTSGQTVVLRGVRRTTATKTRTASCVSSIPYLSRLFTNVGICETEQYLIVTATVVEPTTEGGCAAACCDSCPSQSSAALAIPCPPSAPVTEVPHVVGVVGDTQLIEYPPAPTATYAGPPMPVSGAIKERVMFEAVAAKPVPTVKGCLAIELRLAKGSPAVGLVDEYKKACAGGKPEEAMTAALKALATDPRCFAK